MSSHSFISVAVLLAFSAITVGCSAEGDVGTDEGNFTAAPRGGDTPGEALDCKHLPATYQALFQDASWKVENKVVWKKDAKLASFQTAQLVAAVNAVAAEPVKTAEEAFQTVDDGSVNYTIFQKDGKEYVTLEFGSGENSYGALFEVMGTKMIAAINDGDLMCPDA